MKDNISYETHIDLDLTAVFVYLLSEDKTAGFVNLAAEKRYSHSALVHDMVHEFHNFGSERL